MIELTTTPGNITPQGIQHRGFSEIGRPSSCKPNPIECNLCEQRGAGVSFWCKLCSCYAIQASKFLCDVQHILGQKESLD